jgi:hypothetical protein
MLGEALSSRDICRERKREKSMTIDPSFARFFSSIQSACEMFISDIDMYWKHTKDLSSFNGRIKS